MPVIFSIFKTASSFEFERLSQEKIAIFIVCKENSKVDKKIANIFISQFLSQISIYDRKNEHIYMILDEIDKLGKIFDFAHHVEFARARKMSISAITNNLKRFESIYENDFYTIINYIDTQCLLGTNSKIVNEVKIGSSSLQFFSKKIELNTTTHLVCVI